MLPESLVAGAGSAVGADSASTAITLAASLVRPVGILAVYRGRKSRPFSPLLYRKRRAGCQGLIPVPVRHFQLQRILTRIERPERQQLLHRHLLSGSARHRRYFFAVI